MFALRRLMDNICVFGRIPLNSAVMTSFFHEINWPAVPGSLEAIGNVEMVQPAQKTVYSLAYYWRELQY